MDGGDADDPISPKQAYRIFGMHMRAHISGKYVVHIRSKLGGVGDCPRVFGNVSCRCEVWGGQGHGVKELLIHCQQASLPLFSKELALAERCVANDKAERYMNQRKYS